LTSRVFILVFASVKNIDSPRSKCSNGETISLRRGRVAALHKFVRCAGNQSNTCLWVYVL